MKKNQEVKNFQNSANIQDQLSRSCFDISPDTKKNQKQNPQNQTNNPKQQKLEDYQKIIKR